MILFRKEYALPLNEENPNFNADQICSIIVKTKGYSLIPSKIKNDDTIIKIRYTVESGYQGFFTTRFMPEVQLMINKTDHEHRFQLQIKLNKAYRIMLIAITSILLVFQMISLYEYCIGDFDLINLFTPLFWIAVLWVVTILFFRLSCKYYLKVFKNIGTS